MPKTLMVVGNGIGMRVRQTAPGCENPEFSRNGCAVRRQRGVPAARTRISNSRKRFTLGVESRGDARRTPCPCVDHAAYGGSA